jgi:ATP-binding cassette subfamily C protein
LRATFDHLGRRGQAWREQYLTRKSAQALRQNLRDTYDRSRARAVAWRNEHAPPGAAGEITRSALDFIRRGWERISTPRAATASPSPDQTEMRAAVGAHRHALIGVGITSGLINILALTGPLFMLQVYDRVLPSRSVPTLVGLALLTLALFAFQGLLDTMRGRVLIRIGRGFDETLSPRVFDALMRQPLRGRSAKTDVQSIRDLDNVRSFMSSMGLTAFFDLPWVPVYVAVCFLFHPWIGLAVLLGAAIICSLALMTETMARVPSRDSVSLGASRMALAESARRNAALLQALGMRKRMAAMWARGNDTYLEKQQQTSDVIVGFGSTSRVLRMVVQSGVLGVGAWLVINQQSTAGVILAAAVLSARALAPIELAIANWRPFLAARQSWLRLSETLAAVPVEEESIGLPNPSRNLRVTSLTLVPPEGSSAVLHDVSFKLGAGSALGIIGPTGSGKSSLARALVGVWKPARGVIRLDGATFDQWNHEALGRCIGYLPQEVELFDGTVAQNISRFEPETDPQALIAAAMAAGVHEVILRLPQGYKTQVGEGGALLSGGQRQRIALARALYRDPFLVVLDEPNSNLDAPGEQALTKAIRGVRDRGGIVIVIAHRPSAVTAVDHVLVLNEGRVQAFGERDAVLRQVIQHPASAAAAGAAREAGGGGAS